MANTVVKQITFPEQLLKFLEQKSKEYGYSIPAYVKYVLTKEMEKEENKETIIVDEEFISSIREGNKEFEEGKTVTLKSIQEIEDHFTALADEENEV